MGTLARNRLNQSNDLHCKSIGLELVNSLNARVVIIETSQLVCSASQLTGFYMMVTLAFNELMISLQG